MVLISHFLCSHLLSFIEQELLGEPNHYRNFQTVTDGDKCLTL